MAAIDPTEEIEEDSEVPRLPRSTLKLIKQRVGDIDEDEDEDDEYLRDLLLGADEDDEDSDEEESDEEANGGPSDPSKSKKARRAAALKKLMDATQDEDSDEEMEEPKANGVKSGKGKEKAVDEDDDDEEDSEEDSDDDSDDLPLDNLEQFVVCTLDTERVSSNLSIVLQAALLIRPYRTSSSPLRSPSTRESMLSSLFPVLTPFTSPVTTSSMRTLLPIARRIVMTRTTICRPSLRISSVTTPSRRTSLMTLTRLTALRRLTLMRRRPLSWLRLRRARTSARLPRTLTASTS